jgi:hypothetical protein
VNKNVAELLNNPGWPELVQNLETRRRDYRCRGLIKRSII